MQFVDNATPSNYAGYYINANPAKVADYSDYHKLGDRSYEQLNNFLTMYYQNAYNSAILNYQNQYNSPLQQMLRYQEAGLNPFLAANEPGNMGSSPSGAAPRGSFTAPSKAQIAQSNVAMASQAINALNNTLKTAQGIYDYVKYGRPLQELNLQGGFYDVGKSQFDAERARQDSLRAADEEAFARYWNTGEDSVIPGTDFRVSESPRARYMEQSTQRISAQIEQLNAIINVLYPSQAERNKAGTALAVLQKEVLDGQKGAILHINTGNDTADSILKMVCYWLLNK